MEGSVGRGAAGGRQWFFEGWAVFTPGWPPQRELTRLFDLIINVEEVVC